jgi:hypothetical protein
MLNDLIIEIYLPHFHLLQDEEEPEKEIRSLGIQRAAG